MLSLDLPIITGYSSVKQCRASWLRGMLALLEEQLGSGNFREGASIEDSGHEKPGEFVDRLTDLEIEQRLAGGGLSFVSNDEPDLSGYVSNDRFGVPAWKIPQCEVSVELPSRFGQSAELGLVVKKLCEALAKHAECNLLFCADREHFDIRFDTELHIGIGLLDVYWINVFGPAYARMIGEDKIRACPAVLAWYTEDHYGLIQATKTLQELIEPVGGGEVRRSIKTFLGEQLFAKPRRIPVDQGVEIPAWKIWKIVNLFRTQKATTKDVSRKAERVPSFR